MSELLDNFPYTLCSIEEMESASQIMSVKGISKVMSGKLEGEHRRWLLGSYINNFYNDNRAKLEGLFPEAWATIERRPSA